MSKQCKFCSKTLSDDHKGDICKNCQYKVHATKSIYKLQDIINFDDEISIKTLMSLGIGKFTASDHIWSLEEQDLIEEIYKETYKWVDIEKIEDFMKKYSVDHGTSFNKKQKGKTDVKCKICSNILKPIEVKKSEYCKECNKKIKLSQKLLDLKKYVDYDEEFTIPQLIEKMGKEEFIITGMIWSLQENNLVTTEDDTNYMLQSEDTVNEFLEKYTVNKENDTVVKNTVKEDIAIISENKDLNSQDNFEKELDKENIKVPIEEIESPDEKDLESEDTIESLLNAENKKLRVEAKTIEDDITKTITETVPVNNEKDDLEISKTTEKSEDNTCLLCGKSIKEQIKGISQKYCSKCQKKIKNSNDLKLFMKYVNSGEEFTIPEIVEKSGINKLKILSIVYNLQEEDLLESEDSETYILESEEVITKYLDQFKKIDKENNEEKSSDEKVEDDDEFIEGNDKWMVFYKGSEKLIGEFDNYEEAFNAKNTTFSENKILISKIKESSKYKGIYFINITKTWSFKNIETDKDKEKLNSLNIGYIGNYPSAKEANEAFNLYKKSKGIIEEEPKQVNNKEKTISNITENNTLANEENIEKTEEDNKELEVKTRNNKWIIFYEKTKEIIGEYDTSNEAFKAKNNLFTIQVIKIASFIESTKNKCVIYIPMFNSWFYKHKLDKYKSILEGTFKTEQEAITNLTEKNKSDKNTTIETTDNITNIKEEETNKNESNINDGTVNFELKESEIEEKEPNNDTIISETEEIKTTSKITDLKINENKLKVIDEEKDIIPIELEENKSINTEKVESENLSSDENLNDTLTISDDKDLIEESEENKNINNTIIIEPTDELNETEKIESEDLNTIEDTLKTTTYSKSLEDNILEEEINQDHTDLSENTNETFITEEKEPVIYSYLSKQFYISKKQDYCSILMKGEITFREYAKLLKLLKEIKELTTRVSIYMLSDYIDVVIELEVNNLDLNKLIQLIKEYGWKQ